MKPTEVFKLFDNTWNNSLPDKRLQQIQTVRSQVPPEYREFFDSMLDAKLAGVQDNPLATVVFLIHGIQTDGAWHNLVEKQLGTLPHTNVHGLGYNFVSALQLASPIRSTPINKITQDIRDAKSMEPNAQFMVIAHSFGSYILSRILSKSSDISFSRIILCGCIIPTTYPWGLYTKNMQKKSILNDVGTRDIYPVVATCTSFGYGSSGRKGFQVPLIKDRYFDYGHSDFFEPKNDHIERYWKPFVATGEIVESEWDHNRTKLSIKTNMAAHPWIGRPLFFLSFFATVALICFGIWKAINGIGWI
jgi:pimeloyl-ACP methyl ester carboxylesterase